MGLTANYSTNYPKVNKDGKLTTVFVYTVTGDETALADYMASQGDNYRTSDSGEPLFFTGYPAATDVCQMRKNLSGKNAGRWDLDTAEFRKDKAIVEMAGGNLGQAIAEAKVAKYVAPNAGSMAAKLKATAAAAATSEEDDLNEN
jgi:hypothetical protein